MDQVQIFISYAREDQEKARGIYRRLTEQGYKPWLDEEDLLPGQNFRLVIEKSLTGSDFVIICLSCVSVAKRSFFQREIKHALDKLEEMLPEDIFVIPARLDECKMPEELKDRHWVNLFEERGWKQLFRALEIELRKRGKTPPQPPALHLPTDAPVMAEEPDRATARESEILKIEEPMPPAADEVRSSQKPRQDAAEYETLKPDRAPEPRWKQTRIEPVERKPQPAKAQPVWSAKFAGLIPTKRRAGAIAATVAVALLGYGAWSALRGGRGGAPASPEAGDPSPSVAVTPSSVNKSMPFVTITVDQRGNEIGRETKQANGYVEDLGNDVKLAMVEINGGAFTMGSNESQWDDERPPHQVKVSGFWMGRFEVTREQWREVARMNSLKQERDLAEDPSRFKDSWQQPVESVSWEEAVEFCARLSRKTGKTYRLPTEAEWEYAARAGTDTAFAFGPTITPEIVNYDGNYPYGSASKGVYRNKTLPVGSLGVANAFGLFDMHGNVWERCSDWYSNSYYAECQRQGTVTDPRGPGAGSYRVFRGGGWYIFAVNCRSAYRYHDAPGYRVASLGFRLVRVGR